MDFFGIGLFEIVFILLLAFLVVGPERMGDLGRSAGRLVAQLLAWQQQSPEAQMIQQIKRDFEGEIVELRDEIVRARRQLDVSADVQRLKQDTESLLNYKQLMNGAPADPAAQASAQPTQTGQTAAAAETPQDDLLVRLLHEEDERQQQARSIGGTQPQTPEASPANSVARQRSPGSNGKPPRRQKAQAANDEQPAPPENGSSNGIAAADSAPAGEVPAHVRTEDYDQLALQVETLTAELRVLREQLRTRGLFDDVDDEEWQPAATSSDTAAPAVVEKEAASS
jgi:Sec-independent protein translocase protein TatA